MNYNPEKYLELIEECIREAKGLYDLTFYKGCVTRSYYAAFHCVQLLLLKKDCAPKTHVGLKQKFNELYIKTGIIEKQMGTDYDKLFKYRSVSDYDVDSSISSKDAEKSIKIAEEFFELTLPYFKNI